MFSVGYNNEILKSHAALLSKCGSLSEIIALQQRYEDILERGQEKKGGGRKEKGVYYTPELLARFLVRESLSSLVEGLGSLEILSLRVLDPAMGGGVFLLCAVEYLGEVLESRWLEEGRGYEPGEGRRKALGCIYGFDQQVLSARLCQASLCRYVGVDIDSEIGSGLGLRLRCADSICSPLKSFLLEMPISGVHHGVEIVDFDKAARVWVYSVLEDKSCGDAYYCRFLENQKNEVFFDEGCVYGDFLDNIICLDGDFMGCGGAFDAVLTNPPWMKLISRESRFFGAHSSEILGLKTARERVEIYERLLESDEGLEEKFGHYKLLQSSIQKLVRRYRGSESYTGGHPDGYQVFIEKGYDLLREGGVMGLILPKSFSTNVGAKFHRELLLERMNFKFLVGFENANRMFKDVSSGVEFCALCSRKGRGGRGEGLVSYGHVGMGQLDEGWKDNRAIRVRVEDYWSDRVLKLLPKVMCEEDLSLLKVCKGMRSFGEEMEDCGIHFYQEMNMTLDSHTFIRSESLGLLGRARMEGERERLLEKGLWVVHEKGSFSSYDDLLKDEVRYLCEVNRLRKCKREVLDIGQWFRVGIRSTLHAFEERKSVFCLLPSYCVVGNSALVERYPQGRALEDALCLVAVGNSDIVNRYARMFINTNMKLFLLQILPFPKFSSDERRFLAESALRLNSGHSVYQPLLEDWSLKGLGRKEERKLLLREIEAVVSGKFKV